MGTTVLQIREIPPKPDGFEGEYNERAYYQRGWCSFEDAVSSKLLVRLDAYPRMADALCALPSKVLVLADGVATAVEVQRGGLAGRVEQVVERIAATTFTGNADRETVPMLYKDYVARIANVLQQTLAEGLADIVDSAFETRTMPLIDSPQAPPLRLSPGQLVLVPTPGSSAVHLGNVDETGLRIECPIAGMDAGTECVSKLVLPWLPRAADRDVVHDTELLCMLAQRVRELQRHPTPDGTRAAASSANDVKSRVRLVPQTSVAALCTLVLRAKGDWDKLETVLRRADELAVAAVCESGVLGHRRYGPGQWLTVRHPSTGAWLDVHVVTSDEADGAHRVQVETGELSLRLHPWNHAPREMPHAAFEEVHRWYTAELLAQHSHVTDALSGNRLDVLQQCVAIDVVGGNTSTGVRDAFGLSAWLHTLHDDCTTGPQRKTPAAALLTAAAATGKTSLLSQVVVHELQQREEALVPIVVRVQLLQTYLLDSPDECAASWNWVEIYAHKQLGKGSSAHHMLHQAMLARRALILIDGLDKGGEMRDEIERHVAEVLAPQGHVILATSRPDGIQDERFAGFHRLQLLARLAPKGPGRCSCIGQVGADLTELRVQPAGLCCEAKPPRCILHRHDHMQGVVYNGDPPPAIRTENT